MTKTLLTGLLAASVVTLTGCATLNGGIKPAQCGGADWQSIGYQDGLLGQAPNYLARHSERCSKVGVTPNQVLWEQGRQQGLKRYCTPLRAYQLGREGISYNNVCPPEQMLELLKAHDEGNYYYQLNESWDYFNRGYDPFWGNRWWGSPFYGGYRGFGGFGSLPRPRVLPDYVPTTPATKQSAAPVTTTLDAQAKDAQAK